VNRGQQEYYKRDYAQAKLEGKPFFPYAVYKDLLIATLAIALVIGMAIWHRVEIGEPVNPASTDFVPRPEWYFFFLFELLKIFKGQNVFMPVIMATFIVPNILMVLLIATPFIDRGPERRIQKRPIALFTGIAVIAFLAYMTHLGASSNEGVGAEGLPLTGLDEKGQAGADLFLANGCTACHNVAGVGAPGPGPNLTNLGSQGQTPEYWGKFIQAPPGGVMPSFTTFTPQQYDEIGTFLAGLGTTYK
jgi:menaquinol-cytochrome c reductase cytochrome b/c subunit